MKRRTLAHVCLLLLMVSAITSAGDAEPQNGPPWRVWAWVNEGTRNAYVITYRDGYLYAAQKLGDPSKAEMLSDLSKAVQVKEIFIEQVSKGTHMRAEVWWDDGKLLHRDYTSDVGGNNKADWHPTDGGIHPATSLEVHDWGGNESIINVDALIRYSMAQGQTDRAREIDAAPAPSKSDVPSWWRHVEAIGAEIKANVLASIAGTTAILLSTIGLIQVWKKLRQVLRNKSAKRGKEKKVVVAAK